MKVIGAGLPRTATTTQKLALEMLRLGPRYHMRDLMENFDDHLPPGASAAAPSRRFSSGGIAGRPRWPERVLREGAHQPRSLGSGDAATLHE